jgi:hypothetical protein
MKSADSNTQGYKAKAEPGDDAYKAQVAEPMMNAIDAMPKSYRELVHLFGYVDVFRAWRKGWSVDAIKAKAAKNGGYFEL